MSRSIRHISASHSPSKNRKYSIVIPAAGEGVRMNTYGAKSLLKLKNDQTVLQRQLDIIANTIPFYEIILVTGFQSERVMNSAPNNIVKVENTSFADSNIVKSIGIGMRAATTDNVIVIHGDLVFTPQCLKVPFDMDSGVIVGDSPKRKDEICCTSYKGYVEHMFYDLPDYWTQITYLTGKELDIVRKMVWNKENAHKYFFEILNDSIDKGAKLKTFSPKGAVSVDIDTSKDISTADSIVC